MKMKQMKKVLSLILCVAIMLQVFPVYAITEDEVLYETADGITIPSGNTGDLVTDFTDTMSIYNAAGDFVLDGTVLVGYTGKAKNVVIPASLGITDIRGAFGWCEGIVESVVIPEGVEMLTRLGGSRRLTSVTLPKSLKKIGRYAFDGTGLTSLKIPAGVTHIDTRDGEWQWWSSRSLKGGSWRWSTINRGGSFLNGICQVEFEAATPPIIGMVCWKCFTLDCEGRVGCSEYECIRCEKADCMVECCRWCTDGDCDSSFGNCPEYKCWKCLKVDCPADCCFNCLKRDCDGCDSNPSAGYLDEMLLDIEPVAGVASASSCENCGEAECPGCCWRCETQCGFDGEYGCPQFQCWTCNKSDCQGCCWHCKTVCGKSGGYGCPAYQCMRCNRGNDCKKTIYVATGAKAAYEAIPVLKNHVIIEGAAPKAPPPKVWPNPPVEKPQKPQEPPKKFVLGRIVSKASDKAGIGDALEVLKFLAGMTSVIKPNTPAMQAALITPASIKAGKPGIADALEILKYLAGMSSLVK